MKVYTTATAAKVLDRFERLETIWRGIPKPATPPFQEWKDCYIRFSKEDYEAVQAIFKEGEQLSNESIKGGK